MVLYDYFYNFQIMELTYFFENSILVWCLVWFFADYLIFESILDRLYNKQCSSVPWYNLWNFLFIFFNHRGTHICKWLKQRINRIGVLALPFNITHNWIQNVIYGTSLIRQLLHSLDQQVFHTHVSVVLFCLRLQQLIGLIQCFEVLA